ncbi:hypothetical protein ART_0500 [Arthrobacter sp. PAMC 25486]|nr:hypothetical protein ART_0500 [Arthrobacter sp. PAMC 25486]
MPGVVLDLVAGLLVDAVGGNQAHDHRDDDDRCNDDDESKHVHGGSAPVVLAGCKAVGKRFRR